MAIALKQVENGAHVIDINMDDGLIGSKSVTKFVNLLVSGPDASKYVHDRLGKFDVVEAGLKYMVNAS